MDENDINKRRGSKREIRKKADAKRKILNRVESLIEIRRTNLSLFLFSVRVLFHPLSAQILTFSLRRQNFPSAIRGRERERESLEIEGR